MEQKASISPISFVLMWYLNRKGLDLGFFRDSEDAIHPAVVRYKRFGQKRRAFSTDLERTTGSFLFPGREANAGEELEPVDHKELTVKDTVLVWTEVSPFLKSPIGVWHFIRALREAIEKIERLEYFDRRLEETLLFVGQTAVMRQLVLTTQEPQFRLSVKARAIPLDLSEDQREALSEDFEGGQAVVDTRLTRDLINTGVSVTEFENAVELLRPYWDLPNTIMLVYLRSEDIFVIKCEFESRLMNVLNTRIVLVDSSRTIPDYNEPFHLVGQFRVADGWMALTEAPNDVVLFVRTMSPYVDRKIKEKVPA